MGFKKMMAIRKMYIYIFFKPDSGEFQTSPFRQSWFKMFYGHDMKKRQKCLKRMFQACQEQSPLRETIIQFGLNVADTARRMKLCKTELSPTIVN